MKTTLIASALLFMTTVFSAPLSLEWKLCQGAELKNLNGTSILRVSVPQEQKSRTHCASANIDLTFYTESLVIFSIRARAREVSKPRNYYNGVKFMLHFTDENNREQWKNAIRIDGTFDWKEISFYAMLGHPGRKATLELGLQESSGEVEFDLDSLRIVKLFTAPREKYTARYSDAVRNTPPLRGVMSPVRFKAEDFTTLREWNVNLVRAQLIRNWGKTGTDRDFAQYDSWLNDMLDHYEEMFPLGEKNNIRFIIDLHTLPGGRNDKRELTMFHEKKYADHFLAIWKKIAIRFKDNPAVWGYDLANEPIQISRAPYDYWNLQRQAAEAIRAIDPERPIIVQSNLAAAPETFRLLAPFKLNNIIYQVHMYKPGTYTHQRVKIQAGRLQIGQNALSYPGKIGGLYYDKAMLRLELAPVRDFQKKYGARIYVGEFSAAVWAPGAADYLRDLIEIFEEYGWDWSYHAFRESPVWDVEMAGTDRNNLRPASNTDRKQVLLDAFRKNHRTAEE